MATQEQINSLNLELKYALTDEWKELIEFTQNMPETFWKQNKNANCQTLIMDAQLFGHSNMAGISDKGKTRREKVDLALLAEKKAGRALSQEERQKRSDAKFKEMVEAKN